MSAVHDLDEARSYWATLARENPLNASSLVYGLINDLEDARAIIARVEAAKINYDKPPSAEYRRGAEDALAVVRTALQPERRTS